jgi:hypothetical protein
MIEITLLDLYRFMKKDASSFYFVDAADHDFDKSYLCSHKQQSRSYLCSHKQQTRRVSSENASSVLYSALGGIYGMV